ncbi:MAG: hypothetical protein AUG07_06475 [Acidobacteria bacterium 13_1_20CM_2_60_10]|nr:MAG: hypothetical protein AUG07_06475 [Acidobacteria bacterium 13_1_20CM_2_60_10]PYU04864.1 MAG: hypothetical protein DMG33_12800 [Acidobacteriota bacterium]
MPDRAFLGFFTTSFFCKGEEFIHSRFALGVYPDFVGRGVPVVIAGKPDLSGLLVGSYDATG